MSFRKYADVINVYVISEVFQKSLNDIVIFFYFTWHLYLWQQCFSDMTATFMTPVFFRHNSNIYDISVFSRHDIVINVDVMSKKTHWCHECRCHVWITLVSWMLLTCLKNTDVMNVDIMWKIHWCHQCRCHVPMIFGRVISCHHFFPLGDIDLICGIWVHSDQLQIKFTFRISQSIAKKSGDNCFILVLRNWVTLYDPAT
jgi:hypothetical protein